MSPERRRGLVRLAILLGSIAGLTILGVNVVSGGSSRNGTASRAAETRSAAAAPTRLSGTVSRSRLPAALHGQAVARSSSGLLVIGGETSSGSTDHVYQFDPASGRTAPYGSLAQPLHDAAATTVNNETLVFGGGNTSTFDAVQALVSGGRATPVGHLPAALSDLSAVHVAGASYILGGYDGRTPSASVFQTTDGRAFVRVARLPTPIRYGAAATLGDKIYVFGGELADGSETSAIQEYDIATERSVVAGHLPDAVSHASAVTFHGAIYLLGGRIRGSASDRILRFDPARNVGVPAGRLPQPVFDGAAAVSGDRAYLLGGLGSGDSALDTVITLH